MPTQGLSAGRWLADEPAHAVDPAPCLCLQESELATEQTSAQPEGSADRAAEAGPAAGEVKAAQEEPALLQEQLSGHKEATTPQVESEGSLDDDNE